MAHHDEIQSLGAVFVRVFWMMMGPLCLVLFTFSILQLRSGWLTWADVGYLAVLGAMLLVRWLEFRNGDPRTVDGKPATWGDLRRYVQTALPLGLGVWILANVIANHVLDG
jgi:hypothetical protein